MLSSHQKMTIEKTGSRFDARSSLMGLLASVGLTLTACAQAGEAEKPETEDVKPAEKVLVMANAEEAKRFAMLDPDMQEAIQKEYRKCLQEVDEIVKLAPSNLKKIVELREIEDCDERRAAQIGQAEVAQEIITG